MGGAVGVLMTLVGMAATVLADDASGRQKVGVLAVAAIWLSVCVGVVVYSLRGARTTK